MGTFQLAILPLENAIHTLEVSSGHGDFAEPTNINVADYLRILEVIAHNVPQASMVTAEPAPPVFTIVQGIPP